MANIKRILKDSFTDVKEDISLVHDINKENLKMVRDVNHANIAEARKLMKNFIEDDDEDTKEIEKAIRDRLETGFKNWNGGYDGWLEWCNTLYEPDAHYNIPFNGTQRRCTLEEYKEMMGQLFQHFTMELGDFDNMIIKDNWTAIRYTVKVKNLDTGKEIIQHTMEFVVFKENKDERGVRVVEGWALSDSALS